jgi:hypothetical protein
MISAEGYGGARFSDSSASPLKNVMIAAVAPRHASIQLHKGQMKPDQNLTNVRIHLEIY